MKSVIKQSGDIPHYCDTCGEKIGSINQEAGVFDERYKSNYKKHSCKEWHSIRESK